jgi:hypothetical protein
VNEELKITICSLPDYDNLVAEIYLSGAFIGLVSEEKVGEYVFEPENVCEISPGILAVAKSRAIEKLQALGPKLGGSADPDEK